jgi:hypothetical protein
LTDVLDQLEHALDEWWAEQKQLVLKVGGILSEGGSDVEVARTLGMTHAEIWEASEYIRRVADRLQT